MTVPNTTSSISYAGNGVTTAFSTGFQFLSNGQLTVNQTESGVITPLVLDTDFTVTGAGLAVGGTVTLLTAPAVGATLDIIRDVDLTQETSFRTLGDFSPKLHEVALDKLTMVAQQLKREGDDLRDDVEDSLADIRADIVADPAATSLDDRTVVSTSTSAARKLKDRFAELGNVKDFGAVGNGSTDDTAALTSAAALLNVYFPAGTYVVSSDITFAGAVTMAKGAILSIASSKTVTFNGGFTAPVAQVFGGSGTTAFDKKKTVEGYCEWWGAVPNGPDCLAALNKAKTALKRVLLQPADYFISNVFTIDIKGFQLHGTPHYRHDDGPKKGTRLICSSATSDVVFIGTSADPGGVNNYLSQVEIKWVEIARSVAPAGNATPINAGAGVRLKFTLHTLIEWCWSVESCLGFVLDGTVQARLTNCFAFRSTAGTGADFFWGFFLNGNASTGLAGGNASAFLTDCNATMGGAISATGGAPITSIGFSLDGKFVDTFLTRPETSACQAGIVANGVDGESDASGRKAGNVDLHIVGPIIDTFTTFGAQLADFCTGAAVEMTGGYFAPASASGATACIYVQGSLGLLTLTGNQAICWPTSSCLGLFIENSSGVQSMGNMIYASARPIGITGSSNCRILDAINNPDDAGVTTSQAAVRVETSSRCYIAPIIKGAANKVTEGVRFIGVGCTFSEVNCTGIDPACLTGATTANKFIINGVQIVATGLSGNNLASGVMN